MSTELSSRRTNRVRRLLDSGDSVPDRRAMFALPWASNPLLRSEAMISKRRASQQAAEGRNDRMAIHVSDRQVKGWIAAMFPSLSRSGWTRLRSRRHSVLLGCRSSSG